MTTVHVLGFRVVIAPAWLAGTSLLIVSLIASLPLGVGPRPGGPLSVAVALIVAMLLASVIVGLELLRALVARSRGAPPAEVRVLTLGLPPAPETPPVSPSSEAVIALTAPVTSGLLGIVLVAAGRVLGGDGTSIVGALHWGLTWLGFGVLVVAAFVSVPLLPLDGGRLVRAVAWRVTGDFGRATRVTGAIGRAFGYLVLGAGLVATFVGELLVGLWLLLLGWLATRVARSAAERSRLEELTAGLLVSDAIDRDPPSIGPSLTLDALMTQEGHAGSQGVYPVLEEERLVGVVFTTRISRRSRRRSTELRAADVMVPRERLRVLQQGDALLEAVIRLEGARVTALPVVADDDAGRLIGLVTRDRVLERLRARQTLQSARAGRAGRAARG